MIMNATAGNTRYPSAARTHIGMVRARNEDAVLSRPEIGLWAVADGAGGHDRGDLASGRIVAALGELAPVRSGLGLLDEVRVGLIRANRELREIATTIGPTAVLGSTVVTLVIIDGRSHCLWAGDSRFYLMRSGELRQMTRDQSYVQRLVDRGEISAEAALSHPLAHVLTNMLGASAEPALEERQDRLETGDILLLCSDGLNRAVCDADIAAILRRYPVVAAADQLIERALSRGARDNVSAIVIEYLTASS
jgi:protein phosphatase/serine/threonine-protein phosphatase Stp1